MVLQKSRSSLRCVDLARTRKAMAGSAPRTQKTRTRRSSMTETATRKSIELLPRAGRRLVPCDGVLSRLVPRECHGTPCKEMSSPASRVRDTLQAQMAFGLMRVTKRTSAGETENEIGGSTDSSSRPRSTSTKSIGARRSWTARSSSRRVLGGRPRRRRRRLVRGRPTRAARGPHGCGRSAAPTRRLVPPDSQVSTSAS